MILNKNAECFIFIKNVNYFLTGPKVVPMDETFHGQVVSVLGISCRSVLSPTFCLRQFINTSSTLQCSSFRNQLSILALRSFAALLSLYTTGNHFSATSIAFVGRLIAHHIFFKTSSEMF